jgi:Tol biopolymer transport system component/DNA-binding winged helix-turn-helix (wHTH) protein
MLYRNEEAINLAPKVFDLLLFFCRNHDRVISKDELMDKVWTGTLVTENAISRTLVKVRKALGDDPKDPRFILTVPRKGYRMVGHFLASEHPPKNLSSSTFIQDVHLVKKVSTFKLIGLAFVIVIALFFAFNFNNSPPKLALQAKPIKALTRDLGVEMHPSMSPDLSQLAYTQITAQGKLSHINIVNLEDNSQINIKHARGKLSRPKWSPDGEKVAFLYQHNVVCMIFWAAVSEIENKDNWQEITDCSYESMPNFVFSPDGEYLYFNNRQSKIEGYQVFRVNVASKEKDIVNQPITKGLGNYSFDLSPDGKTLVMLNSEYSPFTRIYTLDLASSTLQQTAQLPYLMGSVIWHHDNKTLIHPSPHPAYELWQSDLSGKKLAVVASNTSRVRHLARLSNNEDFLFSSYLLNRDIHYQHLIDDNAVLKQKEVVELNNSSVMDYLPTLSNDGQNYAFVSKRSSKAEVYISSLIQAQAQKLSDFNNQIKLYDLSFSPDNKKLLILADNQLYLSDVVNRKMTRLPIDNTGIQGASWQDENTLLLSTVRNNDWQLMRYDLIKNALTPFNIGFQGGIYDPVQQQYYLLSDDGFQVHVLAADGSNSQPTALYCNTAFINRKLNLKINDGNLLCYADKEVLKIGTNKDLVQYELDSDKLSTWRQLGTKEDFNIKGDVVIYANMKKPLSDIMQTSSQ